MVRLLGDKLSTDERPKVHNFCLNDLQSLLNERLMENGKNVHWLVAGWLTISDSQDDERRHRTELKKALVMYTVAMSRSGGSVAQEVK